MLERLSALGVEVTPRTNGNLWLAPASKVPHDLLELVRLLKGELLALLRRPRLAAGAPVWHAEEVARRVEREGLCICWADLFGELVAFIADESFRGQVPTGIVCYTVEELKILFADETEKLEDSVLKLIHDAKKHGCSRPCRHFLP